MSTEVQTFRSFLFRSMSRIQDQIDKLHEAIDEPLKEERARVSQLILLNLLSLDVLFQLSPLPPPKLKMKGQIKTLQ